MKTKSALIVVDVQNDFLPGGSLAVPHGNEVVPYINHLMTESEQPWALVVFTQDWHPADHKSFARVSQVPPFSTFALHGKDQVAWPDHCVQGTRGADFADNLILAPVWKRTQPVPSVVFRKGMNPEVDSYSGFYDNDHAGETGLRHYLKQRDVTDLTVVGLATDYCVKFTALDAVAMWFKVTVDFAGCRGIADDTVNAAVEQMAKLGICFNPTKAFP